MTETEAMELLEALGFSEATLALIESEGRWQSGGSGIELDLSDSIIESLSPQNRTALSSWFRTENNVFFGSTTINLAGGDFSALEEGKLSPATLERVKRLAFSRENVLSLMDRPYIMRHLADDEKEPFLRAIFATPSLVVKLVIDESTDVGEVARYWSADGLNPGVEPVLRGVQSTFGVEQIDIAHLLPPLPRRYLFGFTNLGDAIPQHWPDCFWISLQFFRRTPSPRYLDPLPFGHHIETEFEKVTDQLRFGDIVCMFNERHDSFVHSYVHIADDIVYSKNGASLARPFTLTRVADMMTVYLDDTDYRFETYRRKKGF